MNEWTIIRHFASTLYLVSHVRLEFKLCRWAESCRVHLHEPLPVTPWVQTVNGVLYDVKTLMA